MTGNREQHFLTSAASKESSLEPGGKTSHKPQWNRKYNQEESRCTQLSAGWETLGMSGRIASLHFYKAPWDPEECRGRILEDQGSVWHMRASSLLSGVGWASEIGQEQGLSHDKVAVPTWLCFFFWSLLGQAELSRQWVIGFAFSLLSF